MSEGVRPLTAGEAELSTITPTMSHLEISPWEPADERTAFAAWSDVVEEGGAFPRSPPATVETFRSAWIDRSTAVRVARLKGEFAGSYFLRPAYPDLAGHIANAGYLVVKQLRRRGIGRKLLEHSLDQARAYGFDAMLFTLVLEENPSRHLWESEGFREVGRIPNAVDGQCALIYWREL